MARVMAQPFAREHPPAGRAVLVDAMPGWIVVAWISRAGEFCGGAAATVGGRAAPSALNCWLDTVAGRPGDPEGAEQAHPPGPAAAVGCR